MCSLAAACGSLAGAATLRDNQIASGGAAQYLDGTWSVSNPSGTTKVAGHVPGDLVTDLQLGAVIGDPLYETTWKGPNVWDASGFNYSLTFTPDAGIAAAATVWLIFDGVKMAADISLNGRVVGAAINQFVRYRFDVTAALLKTGSNTLVVSFTQMKDARNNEGVRTSYLRYPTNR